MISVGGFFQIIVLVVVFKLCLYLMIVTQFVILYSSVAEVQIQPLEEVILATELNILINILVMVATLAHVSTVDAVTLFFPTKRSSNLAEHRHLGDSDAAGFTHLVCITE